MRSGPERTRDEFSAKPQVAERQSSRVRRVARYGLYLADLRRDRTSSQGIINYSLALAAALPRAVGPTEELVYLVNPGVRDELPPGIEDSVEIAEAPLPETARGRLFTDHVSAPRLVRKQRLDLVHFPKGFLPLRSPSGVATVVTIADDIPAQYLRRNFGRTGMAKAAYFTWAIRHSLRYAGSVVTVSEFSAGRLRRMVDRRIEVLYEGVSLPLLEPAVSKDPIAVLLGSRLRHKRTREAIRWALDAFDELDAPELRLVVTGPVDRESEALCGHPRVVHRPGPLSSVEMAELIRRAQVVLFPSVLEGFGLPPMEAYALGTPAVWARAAAVPEVLGDAPGGFVPDDAVDFRRALREILVLPPSVVAAHGQRLRARYDWERIAHSVVDCYRRTVGITTTSR